MLGKHYPSVQLLSITHHSPAKKSLPMWTGNGKHEDPVPDHEQYRPSVYPCANPGRVHDRDHSLLDALPDAPLKRYRALADRWCTSAELVAIEQLEERLLPMRRQTWTSPEQSPNA